MSVQKLIAKTKIFNFKEELCRGSGALQIRSFSMFCCTAVICGFKPDPSFVVTEQATTGRETPVALPSAEMQTKLASRNKKNIAAGLCVFAFNSTNPTLHHSRQTEQHILVFMILTKPRYELIKKKTRLTVIIAQLSDLKLFMPVTVK